MTQKRDLEDENQGDPEGHQAEQENGGPLKKTGRWTRRADLDQGRKLWEAAGNEKQCGKTAEKRVLIRTTQSTFP